MVLLAAELELLSGSAFLATVPERAFARADADADAELSAAEISSPASAMLFLADTDVSGSLSDAEVAFY